MKNDLRLIPMFDCSSFPFLLRAKFMILQRKTFACFLHRRPKTYKNNKRLSPRTHARAHTHTTPIRTQRPYAHTHTTPIRTYTHTTPIRRYTHNAHTHIHTQRPYAHTHTAPFSVNFSKFKFIGLTQ